MNVTPADVLADSAPVSANATRALALLWADGKVTAMDRDRAVAAIGKGRFVWVHLDAEAEDTLDWLRRIAMPPMAARALIAAETRPRCEPMANGALVNLRGREAVRPVDIADQLASIRMWVTDGFVCSSSRRELAALAPVTESMRAGELLDAGDFIARLTDEITADLDPEVARLGDVVDNCELAAPLDAVIDRRGQIAQARARAIAYRRFISPQHQAIQKLIGLRVDWLSDEDRLHIAEADDRIARMVEELEAIRERAALVHEELTDLRVELLDRRALVVSIVALIFLPLTFLTGLLGMNVSGIPFADEPWAFLAVCLTCLGLAVLTALVFIRAHWLR